MIKLSNKHISKKNQSKAKTAPKINLSKNINVLSRQSYMVNVNYFGFIYAYQPTGLYSFSTGADVRNLAFSAVTSSSEFSNLLLVYLNYRIKSLSVMLTPFSATSAGPNLYLGVNPMASTGNPTNSEFISRENNKIFCPLSRAIEAVTFTFPGIGAGGTNLWEDVTISPSGSLFIGNNTFTGMFSSTVAAYDINVSLLIEFANTK